MLHIKGIKMQKRNEQFISAALWAKLHQVALTIVSLLCLCGKVSAQSNEQQGQDGKAPAKTEVKVGFNNISAFELQKDKTTFFNDFMPTFNASIRKDGFYGNVSVAELLIINNTNLSTINNKCLLEIGTHFGPDTKLFLKSGRDVTELGTVFLNGVPNMKYDTEKTLSIFGNLSEQAVLGIQTSKGTTIELGIIGAYGEGFFIVPNPNQADFWGKIRQFFVIDGWKFVLSTATEIGNTNKIFATATAVNGPIGITGGGNYNFDTNVFNAFVRGAYTTSNGMTYILQGLKKNETYSILLGASKNGVQGFIGVDNITTTQTDTPEFISTPTVNVGISYNFSRSKTL